MPIIGALVVGTVLSKLIIYAGFDRANGCRIDTNIDPRLASAAIDPAFG